MKTKDSVMQQLQATSYLGGGNASYLEQLYEQYLQNPQQVDSMWRDYFASISSPGQDVSYDNIRNYFQQLAKQPIAQAAMATSCDIEHERKQVKVFKLIEAYRYYGHYRAQLDPLGRTKPPNIQSLELVHYGLTTADLDTSFSMNGFFGVQQAPLHEIYTLVKQTYCGTIGIEYKHIADQEQMDWIQKRIESIHGQPKLSKEQKINILQHLTEAEGLERYLGAKYVGQTRFSVEGGDSLIPLLDEFVLGAAEQEVKELIIGMGHRGRLNVLVNLLGKSPADLFQEFEGKYREEGSGDVKYHMGFSSNIKSVAGFIHVVLAFNPSHLEIVDPVVEGSVRSRQDRRNDQGQDQVVPVLLHGDAAFAGQGVVMETFSLSQAPGYLTGGTLHVVVNNQIGFTTSNPKDARSSWYCTDVAKMVEAPIIHVNGDDPEAVVFAARLALDYRTKFKRDVVIDLVCYRRHGHNEGDEPAATQPLMYRRIKQLPTVRKLYADKLIAEGVVTQDEVDALVEQYRQLLDKGQNTVITAADDHDQYAVDWKMYQGQDWTAAYDTKVPLEKLKDFAHRIETLPSDFILQPQVSKMLEDRRKMTAGELPLNWGYAETLAYATLLNAGIPIRISGEDSRRGTFAHRHAVLHDYEKGTCYIPLEHIAPDQGKFTIIDSILSEEAVLGFEYGYASADPNTFVIWEAQYGDFVNGAQVVIDQFISSGEQKWGLLCGLTMFLPHGYEGAGPEHSSARPERMLQLCAEHNMQVCIPTTPAQIFHLLRRQMLRPYRKPLIVMTPKSLLRHKLATSSLTELAEGAFQVAIPEIDDIKPAQVRRVVLCSGKVFYDLLEQRRTRQLNDIAIIRIEQLYPFPENELIDELQRYKKVKEVVWCQEEPKNQGAWYATHHHLTACLAKGQTLSYIGREASASPAAGSKTLHQEQQKKLVDEALR